MRTGCGWLIISIAKELLELEIIGIDISREILSLAKENVANNLYGNKKIQFVLQNAKIQNS